MKAENENISVAQIILATTDLNADLTFFYSIGFRLDNIFPSDNPAVAIISGHGINIRLDKNTKSTSASINILTDFPKIIGDGKLKYIAPNGTQIKIVPKLYQLETPTTQHKFEVRRLEDGDPWVIGRAGMLYRDLIPDRLGGSIIASHICIPNGGPVPDMVHYHTIGFQLIYCYSGWVKLVYEDQGPPFILKAGDCVTQPPKIRHRVLEASDNLEVIEIGVPAEHMTTIDHVMELPTKNVSPDKEFGGQTFRYHQSEKSKWEAWRINGFEFQDTKINDSTKGISGVSVIRVSKEKLEAETVSHNADILFTFVVKGKLELEADGFKKHSLKKGDAFVIPPQLKYSILNYSKDLELLEVSLPGIFKQIKF